MRSLPFKSKKGEVFQVFISMAVGLATIAVVLTVTFLIMSQGKSQMTENSTGWNATGTLETAVDDVPDWIPIVIITTVGAGLLGLVKLFKQ